LLTLSLESSDVVVVAAVAGAGLASSLVDMRTRRVPNVLTLAITSIGFLLAVLRLTPTGVTGACLGLLLGFVLMLPGHLLGATGAGDVKLFAAIGTFLGPGDVTAAFVYTLIAGGVIALLVATKRRRVRETLARTAILVRTGGATKGAIEDASNDNRFPYAPAIAMGTLVAALR
jgi:prepilin peptidase CpaA